CSDAFSPPPRPGAAELLVGAAAAPRGALASTGRGVGGRSRGALRQGAPLPFGPLAHPAAGTGGGRDLLLVCARRQSNRPTLRPAQTIPKLPFPQLQTAAAFVDDSMAAAARWLTSAVPSP